MDELNELIRMNNVHAAYHGDIYILNGVSLSIKRNKITGIIGPNGAGKSTLIKCLSGVLMPSGGDVFFNQNSIVSSRNYCQFKVGYLPESPSGFEDLTVNELISFSATSHGLRGEKKKRSGGRL